MEVMARKYENVSLLDRIPQAMWRGRTKDKIYPHRDHLRCGRLGRTSPGIKGAVSPLL
jgi:hypothetical protein